MRLLLMVLLAGHAGAAAAYIGPGAGIGFLGSIWAILVGLFLALVAILGWPLRRLWRRLRARHPNDRGPQPPQ